MAHYCRRCWRGETGSGLRLRVGFTRVLYVSSREGYEGGSGWGRGRGGSLSDRPVSGWFGGPEGAGARGVAEGCLGGAAPRQRFGENVGASRLDNMFAPRTTDLKHRLQKFFLFLKGAQSAQDLLHWVIKNRFVQHILLRAFES